MELEIQKEDEELKVEADIKTRGIQYTDYGQPFKVSYKMQLVPTEASYNLVIDSQVPMQTIIL